ncbi:MULTISPECIES: GlsB/YeaQ/YmgE family stress response membrane protein [Streptomyces]|uniref:GlsB/YeaQ/YmgE family stress response membrane protein n=1 Tax=Streptomyces hesseae TaxID=3075519 RepID=A0ABU2SPT1_9ACTN|nr:GlsB/YeaQ/YmgE family stress response membrane protein [Streptomyces sp. DSM 40473]MDT0450992.1 GlsB/YeaQ/YmgE family stress response membrane protein [Streptomyces sp. DSM 40473]
MEISGIVSAIVIGAFIGILGRLVVPGRQHVGVVMTVVIGIVAAFVGALISHPLGLYDTKGITWLVWVVQIVLAALGIAWYDRRKRR